ncbi:SDR family oxidoreductase [Candidatus Poriferisodalis sp.]|uniref:SDR family oxidoreductase n=1 Tax=Candidatus Poriferisodalis sp. TaxID=3101277 RepID=UPI003B5C77CF
MSTAGPLSGRVALVTGVSRDAGIAAALAQRLHDLGATVDATGWPAHDAEMPWGEQPLSPVPFEVHRHDLEQAETPNSLVDEVIERHGRLDIVVAAHARSSHQSMPEVDASELDRCWAVNVRSIVLLAQRFAQVHVPDPPPAPPVGRMIWFTSGQHLAPMDDEIAYAVSKGALHQMTASINHALASSRIVANCINPGPVDTGYATGDMHRAVSAQFPDQRWGTPDDIANLVEFLVTDSGGWIRGQVIDAEGGLDRAPRPRQDDVVAQSAGKLTGIYRRNEMEQLRSEWD